MFKKLIFTDDLGNMKVKTTVHIAFPKEERNELGWGVQVLIYTRVVGQNGNFRYAEIVPTSAESKKVITDLQADGFTNWARALVYTDALDTWLKESTVVYEDTDWINPGKAFGAYHLKKRELGVVTVEAKEEESRASEFPLFMADTHYYDGKFYEQEEVLEILGELMTESELEMFMGKVFISLLKDGWESASSLVNKKFYELKGEEN